MKLSFSTLGCPEWNFNRILSVAAELGYDGIELYGDEASLLGAKPFKADSIHGTLAELAKRKLTVSCISAECALYDPSYDAVPSAARCIRLAASLGAKYLRLPGDTAALTDGRADLKMVERRLCELAPTAEIAGVTLLVETNGMLSRTARLRELILSVGSPYVRVLWDVNHPVRNYMETPDITWKNIGEFVRHVHLKDSVQHGDMWTYKPLGLGDLPLTDVLRLLKQNGYKGHLSLEWPKRWDKSLEDPEVIFAHYIYKVRKLVEIAQ